MATFTLARVPEIAVGAGRVAGLGEDVTRLAGPQARVLLAVDPALAAIGLTGLAAEAVAAVGHAVRRFEDISGDAREAQVAEGVAAARAFNAAVVIGLGGGSALDAAKMIAVFAAEAGPLADYRLAVRPLPRRKVVLICAPTTAGTGSEVTSTAVLSSADGTKFWYWGDPLKPDIAILDPQLTVSLPAELTAATGLDALVHAMEAATNRNALAANDLHALEAIRLVVAHLPRAVRDPADMEARQQMLRAACLAGIAIDSAGTALAHNIAHALGRFVPIHHGRAAAIAMAATLDWVIEGNAEAFARVAEAFGLGPEPRRLPARYRELLDEVGLDLTLPEGVDVVRLAARMTAPENAAMRRATLRPVDDEALVMLAGRVCAFGAAAAGRSSHAEFALSGTAEAASER